MALTDQQVDALLQPIAGARVKQLDNMSHVEAYDVRRMLTTIFGFGGWSADTIDLTMLYEQQKPGTDAEHARWRAAYRATVRLTIHATGATYTESAAGTNFGWLPDSKRDDAHDMAMKTAASQALKRAATNLGDQFGLSLYNDGSLAPLVKQVLGDRPARLITPGIWDDQRRMFKVRRDDTAEGDHVTEPLAAEDPKASAEQETNVPPTPAPPADAPAPADTEGGQPVPGPELYLGEQEVLPEDAYADQVDSVVASFKVGSITSQQARNKLGRILMEASRDQVHGAIVHGKTLQAYIADAVQAVKE